MGSRGTSFLLVSIAAAPLLLAHCGGGGGGKAGNQDGGVTPDGGAEGDSGFPPAEPSDPCLTAGYYFDGESDCDVARCPELECECERPPTTEGAAAARETITLSACVPGAGCLELLDCNRICDSARTLTRSACEARVQRAGAVACSTDDDCPSGGCREESVGNVCADILPCAEDGHCAAGSLCRFAPGSVDTETGLPTSLGECSDGGEGSVCYEDDDCRYGKCTGNRCAGGRDGDACEFNGQCASGFCRISDPSAASGFCVSGEAGGSCVDDGDCKSGLHCTANVCHTSEVGQTCDEDADCDSRICVSNRCRGGELGSLCEDDADCTSGVCSSSRCTSGGILAPCVDASDCAEGLHCTGRWCTDKSAGSPCYQDSDCNTLACVRGACSAGENGDLCDAPDDCVSNRCADPAGVEVGECTSGAPGSRCVYDQNCVSNDCSIQGICQ